MSISSTEVVNAALALCGQQPILDLDTDPSENAEVARRFYRNTFLELLSFDDWSFATRTVALTATAVAQNPEFAYSFTLPADFVRKSSTSLDDDGDEYFIEGSVLVTDASAVNLRYVRESPQTAYPPGFVTALEYALAAKLAYPLTKDRGLSGELLSIAEAKRNQQLSIDSQQASRKVYTRNYLGEARHTRGGLRTEFGKNLPNA